MRRREQGTQKRPGNPTQYAPEDRPEPVQLYFNRELSWIEFNARVLAQAMRSDVPLLERLRFLCIVSSNFDEFFMVRVATLKRQVQLGNYVRCPSGLSPVGQLREIEKRVRALDDHAYHTLEATILPELKRSGIVLAKRPEYTAAQKRFLGELFENEVFPVLTPVRCTGDMPLPYTANLTLSVAFLLESESGTSDLDELAKTAGGAQGDFDASHPDRSSGERVAVVQIPQSLERVVRIPEESAEAAFALLEDVIVTFAEQLFPGFRVREHLLFRVTRDADIGVDEERDEDFVEAMERVLEHRERSAAIRLSTTGTSEWLEAYLMGALGLEASEVYHKSEPLDLDSLSALVDVPGFADLRYEPRKPANSPDFPDDEPIWESIMKSDALLYHPYESFAPVVRLLQSAADDPGVLAIKMTLYRTGGSAAIIGALERAAQNGKQVTAVVELKARFDEQRNIEWAERLERAGVILVYGVARLKVHSKALLIVRREERGLRRYVHLSTGNYNDRTAKLYTDMGYFTCRDDISYETGLFFNALTGYSEIPTLSRLAMAPVAMKERLVHLIERESMRASNEGDGLILAKMNSLADPEIVDALYAASCSGVDIALNVRGICMLVPGVSDLSERIGVVSIVGRYLEHARAFYFLNGGNEEVYLSSADWMPRNLERRVELMFPVENERLKQRVKEALELQFQDTSHAYELLSDGRYVARTGRADEVPFNSQEALFERVYALAREDRRGLGSSFEVRRKPPAPGASRGGGA